MHLHVNHQRLSSGITLQYAEQGNEQGIPVVMLHGITDSWHSFEPVMPYLSENVRALSVTMRGHGDSSKPEAGYTPSDMARDVSELMEALEIPAAVIVGHSMGSHVAQQVAIDYPEKTLGLVLIGSFASLKTNVVVQEFCRDVIWPLKDPIDREVAREFQVSTIAHPIPPEYLELFINESLKAPARVWKDALRALLESDHTPQLAKVKVPCLLIWGDKDGMISASDQETIVRGVAGARLIRYDTYGHAPHWEAPERVAEDIREFLGEIASRTARVSA